MQESCNNQIIKFETASRSTFTISKPVGEGGPDGRPWRVVRVDDGGARECVEGELISDLPLQIGSRALLLTYNDNGTPQYTYTSEVVTYQASLDV